MNKKSSLKLSKEKFIEKCSLLYNNKYDYSLVDIKNILSNIKVICPYHSVFITRISTHLRGFGCLKCLKQSKSILYYNSFIEKAKALYDCYDYSLIDKNSFFSNKKVKIICHKHGIFYQKPVMHLRSKCKKCSIEDKLLSFEEFKSKAKEIHSNKYIYDDKYICTNSFKISNKIIIICKKHGEFKQRPAAHLYSKHGCPKCRKIISKEEILWLNFLKIPEENRNKKIVVNERCFYPDGYDPINNIVYEFNGDYWHGNLDIYKPNDINKLNKKTFLDLNKEMLEKKDYLEQNGLKVISIWESEWLKIKKDIDYEKR